MRNKLKFGSRDYLIEKTRTVLLWRGLGVASGFVLDAAILARFGLGFQTDAFFAGIAIPFLIDATLSVQFTQVIIPMLAAIRKGSGEQAASSYLSNVISVWLLLVSALAGMGMAISKLIIPWQVPGLSPSTIMMACHMNMLLVWLVPLCGLAALLSGALYSLHLYGLSSSTKAMNNLAIISVVGLSYGFLGIYSLALGYLVGAAAQCLVLWVALTRAGFRFRFSFDLQDPTLRETAKLVAYPLAGQMLGELRSLLENFCASFYAAGILSALRYASRIIQALSGVLMGSVVTATTPMVAHYVAEKHFAGMKTAIRNGVKLLIFMSVPVGLLLIFDGEKLIRVLFQRGKFSHADATLTSQLVALMTPYILFSRMISITQTPFYAIKDTTTLVASSIWVFFLYLAVIPLALRGLGVSGFPLATSLATGLGALVMCSFARRKFGPMGWDRLGGFSLRIIGASAIGCLGFMLGNRLSTNFGFLGFLGLCFSAAIPSLLGLVAFGCGALIFGLVGLGEAVGQARLSKSRRFNPPAAAVLPDPE